MNASRRNLLVICMCFLAAGAAACDLPRLGAPFGLSVSTQAPGPAVDPNAPLPKAQTVFYAALPEPLADGEVLALALLDEVSGLSLNAQLYPMQQIDATSFSATLAITHRAVVKYRYVRLGAAQIVEDSALDLPIRYRMYEANGPSEVHDVISSWSDKPSSAQIGSIQGRVLNRETGAPIPDILISAAGHRTFTDSAGRFDIQGIGVGTHNLLVYAIDGTYATVQQGAMVAAGLNTAVELSMKASALVRVTFVLDANTDVQGAPVRIAGNLVELGNTFADLRGGVSTVAERMPVLSLQPGGTQTATMSLPAGAYVQYKYTLGDGLWNTERTSAGAPRLREFVVPQQDTTIRDKVDAWGTVDSAPVTFEVAVPDNTPASDLISIQFNSLGWTEPIPMWPLGGNRWAYKLYGLTAGQAGLHYRYCRAGQCDSADDVATAGVDAQGRTIDQGMVDIRDSVGEWAWLGDTEPGALVGSSISTRPAGFVAGVENRAGFQPNWLYLNPQSIQGVQALGANWTILTPGWTLASSSPLAFGLSPATDPFWLDSTIMVSQARAANLQVAVFPVPRILGPASDFWLNAPRDAAWWQNWFEHYRAFAVNFADLASQSGSQALVLGGDWLRPALPGGTLSDGTGSGVPADSGLRWKAILEEVRQHFGGEVWWALPYESGMATNSPEFLSETDALYILWDAPLALEEGAAQADLLEQAGTKLDDDVAPLALLFDKPVILALAYPSAEGVRTGCLNEAGECVPWSTLDAPTSARGLNVDLRAQADLYQAMLNAINSRSFIGGIVSRDYYPPTLLQDPSASVHGKPAADVLWYWFPRLTGAIQ